MSSAAGIVLGAGLASRFGAAKLLAQLDGRPILQHVLDLAAALSLAPTVVVLGRGAQELEHACAWRAEVRLRNDRPELGISESLRIGLAALRDSRATRALVLLGDQPLLSAKQAAAVLAVQLDADRPIVVPRFGGVPGNPVLLERTAWPLAAGLVGDRGMSQLFNQVPQLVRHVDVAGVNPDVDTRSDLAAVSRGAARARSGRRAAADRSTP